MRLDPYSGAAAPHELHGRSRQTVAGVVAAVALLLVVTTAATRTQATLTLATLTAALVLVACRRALLAWPTMLGSIIVVILFIPIRRYTLGGGLPFLLEPYRILIALVLALWVAALLVDPDVRARATHLEWPAAAFGLAVLASLVLNRGEVATVSGGVAKQVTFFASYFFVMFFTASVVRDRRVLDRLIMLIVLGATVLSLCTIYEWRTSNNLFNHLDRTIPVLELRSEGVATTPERGGRVRAYASAQHAIALGALLVMLMPLAVYLYRRRQQVIWMGCAAALVMGALATGSKTAIPMLACELLVFIWLKRAATVRLLPLLVPFLIVVQVAMPGTLGTFRSMFFPSNGSLVAEEDAGQGTGTGRLMDVGPSLKEWGPHPLFGQGFGTRLTSEFDRMTNARILDDQWLSSLLEVGLVGVGAMLWLIVRAVRRLKARAKPDDSEDGWLLTALAASITAYAVGMLTYDAFSFTQVTLLFFVTLGLSAAALRILPPLAAGVPEPAGR